MGKAKHEGEIIILRHCRDVYCRSKFPSHADCRVGQYALRLIEHINMRYETECSRAYSLFSSSSAARLYASRADGRLREDAWARDS